MLASLFPVAIFPQGSLSSSVITTVWVGVFVVCYFNLRFGWVLSGLIVPGYLVPLMIAKPISVVVIVIESIITYLIVRISSNTGTRFLGLFEVFGRERFFALVLVSVMVRITFDGWLLPITSDWVNTDLGLNIDFQGNLQSFGLIIIALFANTFWKPGLLRGLGSNLTLLTITYLLVRFGLSELTNFNVSNLSYMYEDLSSSIFASPKAYIILLTTAYIASRMNMRYGWEYNGILIPSLLALQWYQPEKLLVTLIETLIILFTGKMLVRLPVLARMNFEGARLLLLFFNISFFYKILLGYAMTWLYPGIKVSDYFALGYLVSTLLAIKMFTANIPLRMIRVTTESSLIAVMLASVIGFALTLFLTPGVNSTIATPATSQSAPIIQTKESLETFFIKGKTIFYHHPNHSDAATPNATALAEFETSLKQLQSIRQSFDPSSKTLLTLNNRFNTLGYRIISGPDYWIIQETGQGLGTGSFILSKTHPTGITIELPFPVSERTLLDTALHLYKQLGAGALIIANPANQQPRLQEQRILQNTGTFYHQAHRNLNQQGVLQLLFWNNHLARRTGLAMPVQDQLWVKRSLPKQLSLPILEDSLGSLAVHWQALPIADRQQETTYRNFSTLLLTPTQQSSDADDNAPQLQANNHITIKRQTLTRYLSQQSEHFAPLGSSQYTVAEGRALRFFDREILTPLMALLQHPLPYQQWSQADQRQLASINAIARAFSYQIVIIEAPISHDQFLILTETHSSNRHFWGLYVFRLGASQPFMIQIPQPQAEKQTLTFGIDLFTQMEAGILMTTSAHINNHPDGSANILAARNKSSLYNLVHQHWLRAQPAQHILQIRAFQRNAANQSDTSDLFIAHGDAMTKDSASTTLLLDNLDKQQRRYRFVNGAAITAGYQVKRNAQQAYLQMAPQHHWSTLWLSPEYRKSLVDQRENISEQIRFDALSVPTIIGDLSPYLLQSIPNNKPTPSFFAIMALFKAYIDKNDLLILHRIREQTTTLNWIRWIDQNTHKSFLIMASNPETPLLVIPLHPSQTGSGYNTKPYSLQAINTKTISDFIRYGNQPLLLNGGVK